MATYFAHSINSVTKDGVAIGDCLTAVLANPADKAAILAAIRENLAVMNGMRDAAIAEADERRRRETAEAEAKQAEAEAERDALGTKPEAQEIIKQQKLAKAMARKEAIDSEIAELTKAEIAIEPAEEIIVKA